MPSTNGKIYYGSALVAQPGEPWDYTIAYPPANDGTYTIPGSLIQTFTASGTFTPPAGVDAVHVVVIGGGGGGAGSTWESANVPMGGGGGQVRVFRNVPVSGPVAVTIGAGGAGGGNSYPPAASLNGTASQFGSLEAAEGGRMGGYNRSGAGWMLDGHGHGGSNYYGNNGRDGVQINGTYYGGGGGKGDGSSNTGSPGGAGGGGNGPRGAGGAGTGGGGAGSTGAGSGNGGTGGSGRVMIYSEQV